MARRTFVLEIHGLSHDGRPVRYKQGQVALAEKVDAKTGHVYLDLPGIRSVGPMDDRLDPRGGLAQSGTIVIELATGRLNPRYGDPGILLDRHGPRSAPGWVQLVQTVPQQAIGPDPIYVDRDPSSLGTFPLVVQLNQESIRANGFAGDGTVGNPWRLTGIARGVWGTTISTHYVDELSSQRPYITSKCVTWRSRRATLHMAEVLGRGPAIGPLTEVCRGFLEAKPRVRGTTVEVELVPNAAVVERVLVAGRPTYHLAQNRHYFDGRAGRYIVAAQGFGQGHAWREPVAADALVGSSRIPIDTSRHSAVMDTTLPVGHPRRGRAHAWGAEYEVSGYLAGPDALNVGALNPVVQINQGQLVGNPEVTEAIVIDFTGADPVLKDWPIDAFAKLNNNAAWMPGAHTGAGGQWVDMAIVAVGIGLYGIRLTANVPAREAPRVIFWNGSGWPGGEFGPYPIGDRLGGDLIAPPSMPQRLHYPIDYAQPDDDAETYHRLIRAPADSDVGETYLIRGLASAWYQASEIYVTADAAAVMPAFGDPLQMEIRHHGLDGEEQRTIVNVRSSTDVGGGAHAWELDELEAFNRVPSFGDWPGRPRVRMLPTVQMTQQPAREVLLRLLCSNGGNRIQGAFDRHAFGAGLHESEIDVDSFLAFPFNADRWDVNPKDDDEIGDIIEPILLSNGAALAMTVVDGVSKLRIVSVGAEVDNAVHEITDRHWAISPMPEADVDSEIVNTLTVEADYVDDKPLTTVTRQGGASVAAYGSGEEMTIEARGLTLPAGVPPEEAATIRDLAATTFARLGAPRRIWRATTTTAKGLKIQLGDVVRVTSRHLRGFADSWGVNGAFARVIRRRLHLSREGCELELLHTGINAAGFAPAADVLEIVDANTIRVSVNEYTRPVGFGGVSQYDIDGYAVGDLCLFEPRNDNDNALALPKILTVDRTAHRITFDSPHGIGSANGVIVQAAWDDATATQKAYAYLADDSLKLGAADDPGVEIA